MKFKKMILWVWMIGMLASASATFYLGIKSLSMSSSKVVSGNLSKVMFSENEWQNFINRSAEIDQYIFINTFLRRIESQSPIPSIKFEFEGKKAVVTITDSFQQYKWFYNLV